MLRPRSVRSSALRRLLAVAATATLVGSVTQLASPPGAAADDCSSYPFRDPSLPMSARIDDLLGRLTLDEKISLLHQYQQPIPRLCIGLFKAGTEALHGVAWSNDYHTANGDVVTANATTFPQAVGLASTWDPALMRQVGSAVGDEARGLHSENPDVWGLDLWAPVVNLLRDPRWGRNEEGYSEDPTLTSTMATAYGSGIEGDDPTYLKAAPTLKHFLAYNNEVGRDVTSSNVPPRVMREYDLQAFEPTLRANAATGVMASYNLVNGRPNTVSPLLNEIRSLSDKPLFNVSDAFAPGNLAGSQHYYATQPEADAAMFKSGIDSYVQDNNHPQTMIDDVKTALDQGFITVADIERADRHALSLRFRLGEFDPDGGPYGGIDASAVDTAAHRQLARKAADEAMVLLKNDDHALPLDAADAKKVAVIGPLEDTLYTDWYGGNPPYRVTPLDGITERVGSGGTVTGTEAVDRIALKDVATGKYLTAGSGSGGGALCETAPTPDATTQFDSFDWGQGVLTLRSVANGKYVGYNWSNFVNDQAQPNGWFVQQQFKLEQRPDGNYVIRYAGYECTASWSPCYAKPYLTLQPDGTVNLGAATADAATEFAKDVVRSGTADAVAAAKSADTAVVVVGSMPFINGREDHDRTTMALAAGQEQLIKAVLRANPNTVVVLETSYPDTINWEQDNVPAILWTTHAGQETGHAIADTLFGDYNPSGRLTQTWYRSGTDLPSILDYDIIKSNRTYLYYRGEQLYPFGYGLSYATFRYSDLRVDHSTVGASDTMHVTVRVTNTGHVAGDEVVQLYSHQRTSRDKVPVKQLQAFERVHLAAGQSKDVQLTLPVSALRHWDVTRDAWVVETSAYALMVGPSSKRLPLSAPVSVHGTVIAPRDLSRATRAEDFDDYAGVRLVDESKTQGTSVGATADGQWVKYADASLAKPDTFTARVAKASAGATTIQVRLDSPSGRLLGTAQVAGTGDAYNYDTVTAPLATATGRHSVYLVLGNGVRLSTFSLS
jgi:beta-glucosidase